MGPSKVKRAHTKRIIAELDELAANGMDAETFRETARKMAEQSGQREYTCHVLFARFRTFFAEDADPGTLLSRLAPPAAPPSSLSLDASLTGMPSSSSLACAAVPP